MVVDIGYWGKVAKRLFTLSLSIVGFYLLVKFGIFYMPFVIAFLIAMLVEPIVKYIYKKTNLTRKTTAILVLIIVSAILIGLISWGVITVASESYNFLNGINEYSNNIYDKIQTIVSKLKLDKIKVPDQIMNIIQDSTQNIIGNSSQIIGKILNSILKTIGSIPTIRYIYSSNTDGYIFYLRR